MGLLDRLRGRKPAPAAAPETVRCPTCGEENRPSALFCAICRAALPPRPEQQARSPKR